MDILQPPGWARPRGYSNGVVASGRLVFVSGQIGWDANCQFQSSDFIGQARQALQNVLDILAECGGKPEHVMRLTWYIVDRDEYLRSAEGLGKAYRKWMGNHSPAMTALGVAGLIEAQAKVETEATAVVP